MDAERDRRGALFDDSGIAPSGGASDHLITDVGNTKYDGFRSFEPDSTGAALLDREIVEVDFTIEWLDDQRALRRTSRVVSHDPQAG
jgi:hypothetical protein